MKEKVLTLILFIAFCSNNIFAQVYNRPGSPREKITISGDWKFIKSDSLEYCFYREFDDLKWGADKPQWETVKVPHSLQSLSNQEDFSNMWYRKNISIPASDKGKTIYLKFDGAGITATVYLNEKLLGKHTGAYTAFIFDATYAVNFGGKNVLAVKCDSKKDIQGNLSRPLDKPCYYWHVVGGLYRNVHILKTKPCHINSNDFASSGVYVTPSIITTGQVELSIKTVLQNNSTKDEVFNVKHTVCDQNNKIVQQIEGEQSVYSGSTNENKLDGKISEPQLWSPQNPVLYKVYSEIWVNGKLMDVVETTTGFRNFEKIEDGRFRLNGEPIRLIGASLHARTEKNFHAYSYDDALTDLESFKNIGFNSIFLSHYPFPEYVYDLCDELGLLVWAENGYVRGSFDPEISKKITQEMVLQNWNHPSIFCWSIGNELDRKSMKHSADYLSKVVYDLKDPNRLIAYNQGYSLNPEYCNLVTRSNMPGWYPSYGISPFAATFRYINQHGVGSHIAMQESYKQPTKEVDYWEPEAYQEMYAEIKCTQIFKHGMHDMYYWWQYKDDECAKLRQIINSKGIVTFDGFPKDIYYLFRSFGKPDEPLVYICGKHWFLRDVNELKVYSNSKSVKLQVNGKKYTYKKNGEYTIQDSTIYNVFFWEGILKPGKNEIEVTDGSMIDKAIVYYKSTPEEKNSPIKNLSASTGKAYFINMPVREQYPFYADFKGNAINTFDELPQELKGSKWISTLRQSDPKDRTPFSFEAKKNIDVFILSSNPQPVASSSIMQTNGKFASNLVDGNLETSWMAGSPKFPQWCLFDLGKSQKLSEIRLTFEKPNQTNYVFDIFSSNDGLNWSPLALNQKTNNTEWDKIPINPSNDIHFIKIDITSSNERSIVAISEIEFFDGNKKIEFQKENKSIIPGWITNAKFQQTGISGKWRDNEFQMIDFNVYKKSVSKGAHVDIKPDGMAHDFVVLIKEK